MPYSYPSSAPSSTLYLSVYHQASHQYLALVRPLARHLAPQAVVGEELEELLVYPAEEALVVHLLSALEVVVVPKEEHLHHHQNYPASEVAVEKLMLLLRLVMGIQD